MDQNQLTRYMNVCRANRMSHNTLMTYERSLTFLCSSYYRVVVYEAPLQELW